MYSALIPSFYAFFFTMIVYLIHINNNETTKYLTMPKIREIIEELNNKKNNDSDCAIKHDYIDNWGQTKDQVDEPEVFAPEHNEPEVNEPEVNEPEVNEPEVNEPELTDNEKALEAFKQTDKYKYLTKYKLTEKDKDLCNLDKNNTELVYEYNTIMKTIIVMGYDFEYEYFTYWSNVSIPFYFLNVVAIKYVNEYNRSYLFSNQEIIKEEEKDDKNENSVFIKVENNEKRLEKRFINNHFKQIGNLRELNVVKLSEKKPKNLDFKSFSEMFTGEEINLTRRRDRSL